MAKLKELSDTARNKLNSLVSRFKKPQAGKERLVEDDHLREMTPMGSEEAKRD